jgi:crotonobetainyl-CoA:carnitine CoA-transferase CaiB-like acyl-CoA transferase
MAAWIDDGATAARSPLAGVTVLDLGQYIAGPLVGTLLADQGAAVVRIEPPGGPRWRHPSNVVLHRARQTHQLDLHDPDQRERAFALLTRADVLVENFRPGVADRLGLGWEAVRARHARLIYCSLPAFAAEDERAGLPGWEAIVLAAAGAYARVGPDALLGSGWWPGEQPVWSPLPLASVFAASLAALAIVAALIARDRDGVGQRVEVSLFGAALEAEGARMLSYDRRPRGGRPLGSGLYRCADGGYASFIATRIEHLEALLEAARAAADFAGIADYELLGRDRATRVALAERLVSLFGGRTSDEWEALAVATGIPLAKVRPAREWMLEPQALASGAIVEGEPSASGRPPVVGPAALVTRAREGGQRRAVLPAAPGAGPFAGVHVLDLTRVVAGPTATRLLAELGADVIKADADPRTRRIGYREPLFHEHLNRGKRSILMDLATAAGRALLARLVRWADVVVVNSSRPALERLGLLPEAVHRIRPDVVFVYLNAFGTRGPWSDRRGFAESANVATGVTWRTLGDVPSGAAPQVDFPRSPFTDYLAGILAAFAAAAALRDRAESGAGQIAETSLVHATCYAQLPYLLDGEDGLGRDRDRVEATGWRPLHRLYAATDGWIAIGGDDGQREPVATALGITAGARFAQALERALAALSCDECCRRLAAAGVAAQHVLGPAAVMAPRGPADRAGLRDVQRSAEFGLVVQPANALRLERTPTITGRLPTPFGADAAEILDELA